MAQSPERLRASIAVENQLREERFWEFVNRVGWHALRRGQAQTPGDSVIIGIAIWSKPDVDGLKKLAHAHTPSPTTVYVFSIDETPTIEEVRQLMPGVPPFTQTPIVAEYRQNRLLTFKEGRTALEWLNRQDISDTDVA